MLMASRADKPLVVEILVHSFRENPSVRFITGERKHREKRLKALMEYSFDVCYESGHIYLNAEKTACALVLFPERKRTTVRSVSRDIKLILKVIGLSNVPKVLKRNTLIERQYPSALFYYLWFIGVLPAVQHKKQGTLLLKELIKESDQINRPLLLETSVQQHIAWYEKNGFYSYHRLYYHYELYFLRRDAQNS